MLQLRSEDGASKEEVIKAFKPCPAAFKFSVENAIELNILTSCSCAPIIVKGCRRWSKHLGDEGDELWCGCVVGDYGWALRFDDIVF